MHILFLAPHYSPDLGPSAPMFVMLSEGLVKRGHQVTVVTTVPHYPTGQVPSEYGGFKNYHNVENGVEVIRIALPSVKRSNLIYRFGQFLCYQFRSTLSILTRKYDVVLVANPSLWIWLPFFWSVTMRRKPAVYSVYDVYPDVGIALGIFRHKLVIKVVTALEGYCLRKSQVIHILADSFRPGLRALGVEDAKMKTIHVWVDTEFIHPLPKRNSFSLEHQLTNSFVLLYAGNMGYSQGLESIIEAARKLEGDQDIQFVLVGDGNSRGQLLQMTKQYDLKNVTFLPFQPRDCLPELMASADAAFVSMRKEIGNDSIPSKIFSILASGRPILACVDENTEAKRLICQAEAGICVPPKDPALLTEALSSLKGDRNLCETLGGNGRLWAEKHHSPGSASEKFESLLLQAIEIRVSDSKSNP
jgi:colanic acid biosynthesis glycosyl transferase WcaI